MLAVTFIVLAIILVDIWSGGLARSYARTGAVFVGYGAQLTLGWISSARFFSSRRVLLAENETLRAALYTLEERSALLLALQEENAALRSTLSLPERERGITAPVVSSFRASPYSTFLIGAGEDTGVANGNFVLSGSSFVIGVVTDSASRSALVTAIFAYENTVHALVSDVSIVVEGRGGGNARAEAPRSAKISPGDVVTAPEYGGRPIGVVGEVVVESGDAAQTLFIRLPVNLASLRFVYVVK